MSELSPRLVFRKDEFPEGALIMGKERKLFKSEERRNRSDVSAFLRQP